MDEVMSVPLWSRAVATLADAQALVEEMLGRALVHAGGRTYRPIELELYLATEDHADPFTHGHPAQERAGRWYLHRAGPGGGFKSGSFKGVDLACGRPGAPAGVLVRSLLRDDGRLISGPSLCVDELLTATGCASVAALDAALGDTLVAADAPVRLVPSPELPERRWFRTARVGLTLKNQDALARRMAFVMRRYRWLSAPRAVKKGRLLLVLALIEDGFADADIRALTGSPRASIERARSGLDAGRALPLADFVGASLDSATLARMYGSYLAEH